jgi:two-component sensor histidine kinase
MAETAPPQPNVADSLMLAMVASSDAPLLLLDGDLIVIAASQSFGRAFEIDAAAASGRPAFDLGAGEWQSPKLRSLLSATASGHAAIDAYEMDLERPDHGTRRLVIKAQKLQYADAAVPRILMTVSDVTDARIAERLKDDLLRDKAVLMQEVQHRVANSLQIIASVLMQSARGVLSEEARTHLTDAHNRVMSIATVQKQLAQSAQGDVELRPYFTQLCQSLGASMIRDHQKQSIEVSGDKSKVGADVSISLGLIVTELVINALKHAFPGERAGKIMVDYTSRGPNWTLSIGDDGVGMPEAEADATPGLGTTIVEALARQLKARVTITGRKPGTSVSIAHVQIAAVSGNGVKPPERAV